MASQTNEQAFEAAIEKYLCGISSEEWKKLGETAAVPFDFAQGTGSRYHIGNPSKIKRQLHAQTQ
ncbi:hypothetical protein [Thiothrix subterranea]|uniref:Uncharacterized protein n=1 Tax=Thiothrix subterranea TaxID=2735563 RepID=A0AA51MQ76_9GAMM|nr:hypothetical protein [Thiothrix subterranea]WML88654.1 hypothetical protein RCG00_09795 [Thiothrix subterranea]